MCSRGSHKYLWERLSVVSQVSRPCPSFWLFLQFIFRRVCVSVLMCRRPLSTVQMFFQVCHLPVTVLVTYLGCPAHFQDFKYIPLFRCIFCFLFDSFGGSTRARSEVGLTWLGLFCD